jgi:hypothetical protein
VSLKEEFSRKVTSGQIADRKECATNAFLWQKFRTISFYV